MKNLSRFDLGMIIAFAVVTLLGGACWYYLSSQLAAAQADAAAAAGEFDTYSKKEVYLPTKANVKTLQANIDLMTAQLDPLVKNKLQPPNYQLDTIQAINTVEWKHKLDDEVRDLNSAAKLNGITVPNNFYYGFSRYLNVNPAEDATTVLSRQLLGVKEIADILIKAPVHAIIAVRRTYEEDPPSVTAESVRSLHKDQDELPGRSQEAAGNVYTAYPFEVEFDSDTDGFRKFVNDLMQSHYVFVIRNVMVQNQKLDSPKISDLATMAGTTADSTSLINSSPGQVAAQAAPTVGVQYLFGNETLHVRARIDLIDWHGIATDVTPSTGGRQPKHAGAGASNHSPNGSPAAKNPAGAQ